MAEFKQIISNALDILKFDGAVQDTLAELREKWGAQVPALLDERFDAVGVQYMKLSHEKGAAALGQELSAFGWALYNLDDEDEYLFALIPEEERGEWEHYCKKQGQYCHLMKQQGRKWGDHAKEQDPGKLMPTIISSTPWRVILRRENGKTRMQKNGKTAVWPICASVRPR